MTEENGKVVQTFEILHAHHLDTSLNRPRVSTNAKQEVKLDDFFAADTLFKIIYINVTLTRL